ncbi:pqn-44 [Pristionchus pacificus]|uniref:polynucleotide adenylyltransferase n=1 Tax=Pristionchus pacificus TaxID=54126 RepID=A0A2A6BME7_PRIPA|nr:pqn-44 [Pristionchus pacificus]|eukprot:PDM66941.1 pqn-44 [Pristionchus pacificus]
MNADAKYYGDSNSLAAGFKRLNKPQMERLQQLLNENIEIDGAGNFPEIILPLRHFVVALKRQLVEFTYSDIDLIISADFGEEDSFNKAREALLAVVLDQMPSSTIKSRISAETLTDVYVKKMIKVSGHSGDKWSLFSFNNNLGRCLEIKFVDSMQRQYEFSVDSFQVLLDPLLEDAEKPYALLTSAFRDVDEALFHLEDRLIKTVDPEKIRGGGLLKYCQLLIKGFKAADPEECHQMEKYMCSRFFIDFPDLPSQETKLRSYMDSHFANHENASSLCGDETDSEASSNQTTQSYLAVSQAKYDFLMMLYRVISSSTVCLMHHDRRQTLQLIDQLAYHLTLSPPSMASLGSSSGAPPRVSLLYFTSNQWIQVV